MPGYIQPKASPGRYGLKNRCRAAHSGIIQHGPAEAFSKCQAG